MLTFFTLLKTYNIDPQDIRLVRHGNKEIPVLETFQNDLTRFTEYTAWQRSGRFGHSKYIALFAPAKGTTSLFLGIWAIKGVTENKDLKPLHLKLLKKFGLPERWFERSVRYDLSLTNKMADLSERLIVQWGKSTVSWVQTKDKDVVEIRAKNSIGEFTSHDRILLSYEDLGKLIKDSDSNATWVNALSNVYGVYLIKNTMDGRLYVGSAYGAGGILGRWTSYARSGHAGNKLLKDLDPRHFEFSVLEICPATMSADDVIARENRWKDCLGTREFGLNEN